MNRSGPKHFSLYRDIELEAFYDVAKKDRRKIIFANLMIHLFPVLLVTLYYWQYTDFQFAKIAIGLGIIFYLAVNLETTSYLFPSSRKFYKKYIFWFNIPILLLALIGGYYVGQELMNLNIELEKGLLDGLSSAIVAILFVTLSFIWAHIGLSQIFLASRSIYQRKAEMEADMRFATEVQNRILKDIHISQNGTEAYACAIPANELGGDFFELSTRDSAIFASIGDISGHSFGAGLLMTMAKSALQTHLEYNNDPSAIMEALNRMMLNQTDRAIYATMTLLQFNQKEKLATLCNAGHLPIMHYQKNKHRIEYRHKKGFGLGISDKAVFSNLEFNTEPGDLLILYSDGLIETRDDKLMIRDSAFFEEIVMNAIDAHYDTPKSLSKNILSRVRESDYSQKMEDDSTIIVIGV